MNFFPCGTLLVMETNTANTQATLISIDYKYNIRKALCFLITIGNVLTEPGESIDIRLPYKYGNFCVHHIACCYSVSNYFKYSNKVHLCNQAPHINLALEKVWVTLYPYFCLCTTQVGMIAARDIHFIMHYCRICSYTYLVCGYNSARDG